MCEELKKNAEIIIQWVEGPRNNFISKEAFYDHEKRQIGQQWGS